MPRPSRRPDSADTMMSPAELSELLRLPLGTLANWRYLRRGPTFLHVGRHVRYRRSDVDRWLQDNTRTIDDSRRPSARL